MHRWQKMCPHAVNIGCAIAPSKQIGQSSASIAFEAVARVMILVREVHLIKCVE